MDGLLAKVASGTKVRYITGNHDAVLRAFTGPQFGKAPPFNIGEIKVFDRFEHVGVDGKRYLVIHGDLVEGMISSRMNGALAALVRRSYGLFLSLNELTDWILKKMGVPPMNIVGMVKRRSRTAAAYVRAYENLMAEHARSQGYDGVICGHIHFPNLKTIDGIDYRNCGDWLENCTAVAERRDGSWEILDWRDPRDQAT